MDEFADFEMMESSLNNSNKEVVKSDKENLPEKKQSNKDKVIESVSDNFENILNLAGDIVEIKKMQVQADAVLGHMREKRQLILDEAEAYARKKNVDTKGVIERMNVIRSMMQDYYAASNNNISSEDFRAVITDIVNQMGRI